MNISLFWLAVPVYLPVHPPGAELLPQEEGGAGVGDQQLLLVVLPDLLYNQTIKIVKLTNAECGHSPP